MLAFPFVFPPRECRYPASAVCISGWDSAFSLLPSFLLVKSLCGLEASQVPAVEALSGAGEPCDVTDSSDEMDAQEESIHERPVSRKKKSRRHRGTGLALLWFIRPVWYQQVENPSVDRRSGTGFNMP